MKMIRRDDRPTRGLFPLLDETFWDPFAFFGSRPLSPLRTMPAMNIAETAKELTVTVHVPGLDAQDIAVDVHNNLLTISGKTQEEKEEKETTWVCRESVSGEFQRQVRLPDYADGTKAACKVKNGVLTITIPKREEAARKTLNVEQE
ncbi:MAG: Hsp20/alpha crystallin family protein [Candidatus Peribacteraceae bacterium]|nr:Hsp20/alpha crystallin family protein [Candidatus Peribacteraceae bacterium]